MGFVWPLVHIHTHTHKLYIYIQLHSLPVDTHRHSHKMPPTGGGKQLQSSGVVSQALSQPGVSFYYKHTRFHMSESGLGAS